MSAELHGKILAFLASQFALKNHQTCVKLDLLFSPGQGFKDETVRSWDRKESPELFDTFVKTEELTSLIIEIAEGEADAKAPGRHRFVVRTTQFLNGRASHSFVLSPAYNGDETALSPVGGRLADTHVIAQHASQLMRINGQMFDGAIRVLGAQNEGLRSENSELRAEVIILRREIDEARSNKLEREFQVSMGMEKNARANEGFKKLLQLGTVVAAKMGMGGDEPGTPTPLAMLVGEFGRSLRPEQVSVLFGTLDMAQKMMFMEIMNSVAPSPEASAAPQAPVTVAPNGANGAPHP